MGMLFLSKVPEECRDCTWEAFSITPNQEVSETVVEQEQHDAVLSFFHRPVEYVDECMLVDNEA